MTASLVTTIMQVRDMKGRRLFCLARLVAIGIGSFSSGALPTTVSCIPVDRCVVLRMRRKTILFHSYTFCDGQVSLVFG